MSTNSLFEIRCDTHLGGMTVTGRTEQEAREKTTAWGWHEHDGKDICRMCWEKGER